MTIDRRLFLAGAAALAAPAAARAAVMAPGATLGQQRAIEAIAAYLEAHRAHFALPAMGMVVTDGAFTAFINSGQRDYQGREPLRGDELWQIGSISKSIVALVCLQLAQEGKIDLAADIRTVLPEAPLPDGAPFTIRALLDHTTGLPDFAPTWPVGGKLWRGFDPGEHWSYSNVAYSLIGDMIVRVDGRPLAKSIEARVMAPLGMGQSRGAIIWQDRARHPASYSPLRPDVSVLQQNALAPAPWVDVSFGAGSVAATLSDMARYLRFLVGVGRGKGGALISDAMTAAWLAKPVVQVPDVPTETYGLGLMQRMDEGRKLLHHTGGMVSFSSSFHVDPAAGTGAFASCAIGMTGYRPRLLTAFAVKALRLAAAGQPIPAPPPLGPASVRAPSDYVGAYGSGVTISGPVLAVNDQPLEAAGEDRFVTGHPAFAAFPLMFVRDKGAVVAIDHGGQRFVREGASAPLPETPAALTARAGRYQSDDPWIGGVTIVARGDRLLMGGADEIVEIGNDVWRAADPVWSPERLMFASFVKGRPQVLMLSGRVLERRDV